MSVSTPAIDVDLIICIPFPDEDRYPNEEDERRTHRTQVRKRRFCNRCLLMKHDIICQDRLGTNTGKASIGFVFSLTLFLSLTGLLHLKKRQRQLLRHGRGDLRPLGFHHPLPRG